MLATLLVTVHLAIQPLHWEGRYTYQDKLSYVAIRLTRKGSQYVVRGQRGSEKIVGQFDPKTLKIEGKFLYRPRGSSTLKGNWDSKKRWFDITDDQGDALIGYHLTRG